MSLVDRLGTQHIWSLNSFLLNSRPMHPVSLSYLMEMSNFLFNQTCFIHIVSSLSIQKLHFSSCSSKIFRVVLFFFSFYTLLLNDQEIQLLLCLKFNQYQMTYHLHYCHLFQSHKYLLPGLLQQPFNSSPLYHPILLIVPQAPRTMAHDRCSVNICKYMNK